MSVGLLSEGAAKIDFLFNDFSAFDAKIFHITEASAVFELDLVTD